MNQITSIADFIGILRRRVLIWLPIILLGIIFSVSYALKQPKLYETTAVIQVANPQISQKIESGTVQNSTAQYLQQVEQRIMARDNVLRIVEKFGLFANGDLTQTDKVNALRTSTRIEQILNQSQAWQPNAAPSALNISVRMNDPQLAVDVAQELVTSVLDQSRQSRIDRAKTALSFFQGEELRVNDAIAELDVEVAEFKRKYANSLPGAQSSQLGLRNNLETAMLEVDQKIVELQSEETKLLGSSFQNQMRLLRDQKLLIASRISQLDQALDAAPFVETQYSKLTRRLQQLEEQYSVITKNRAEAEIGQMLQSGTQSNDLVVLENPTLPDWPVSPNRKKIVAMGGIVSILLAVAATLLTEFMNPVLRNAAQLEKALQITPVVSVPHVSTARERAKERLVFLLFLVVLVAIAVYILQFIASSAG